MTEAMIVSAVRTPIATAYKGTLRDSPAETLASHVLGESVRRSGLQPDRFDDVILAESLYGGGDLARYAAVASGMTTVSGQAVNRHCAGSLTAVGNAAGVIRADMESAVIAGGAQSTSLSPTLSWKVTGSDWSIERMPPTFPHTADATDDVSLIVGWSTAVRYDVSREEMDAWALRSHERAVAAIDAGVFNDEIAPLKLTQPDGSLHEFAVDEHPRRDTSAERLSRLKPIHPEIPGFSITAGNSSGLNDAAAAIALVSDDLARSESLNTLGRVRAWAAVGVDPRYSGQGAIDAIRKVLARADLSVSDIHLWEINEAFASVPVAACRELDIDDTHVNAFGSGCSLGHPIAASGARMLATLTFALGRRGGGIGLAAMCAGGGQGGAVVIEVS